MGHGSTDSAGQTDPRRRPPEIIDWVPSLVMVVKLRLIGTAPAVDPPPSSTPLAVADPPAAILRDGAGIPCRRGRRDPAEPRQWSTSALSGAAQRWAEATSMASTPARHLQPAHHAAAPLEVTELGSEFLETTGSGGAGPLSHRPGPTANSSSASTLANLEQLLVRYGWLPVRTLSSDRVTTRSHDWRPLRHPPALANECDDDMMAAAADRGMSKNNVHHRTGRRHLVCTDCPRRTANQPIVRALRVPNDGAYGVAGHGAPHHHLS